MISRSLALLLLAACASTTPESAIQIAHLGRDGGDPEGLAAVRAAFTASNPGYDVEFDDDLGRVEAGEQPLVVFIQDGVGAASVRGEDRADSSRVTRGDIVLVRPGSVLTVEPCAASRPGEEERPEGGASGVVFEVPEPLPDDLPSFIRADWDVRITDTPGGCAEEEGAYRRVLLTWLGKNGPYLYHSLNAHRVRIVDSFSHYHPVDGGFDEFYLVQMAQPGARIVTSEAVARIEDPESVTAQEAAELLRSRPLEVGDLIYLPRGTMHRGLGGVLAQVITTPGFRPGAEIGVDHHLRRINEHLGLEGEKALPYHEKASLEAVVK